MEKSDVKRLKYLNLEFVSGSERRTIDDVQMYCFSHNHHKHKFHSENSHLNLLSDLRYSFLHNFASERSSNSLIYQSFINLHPKQKKLIISLEDKLDFLKNQQNIEILRRLSTKDDIEVLLQRSILYLHIMPYLLALNLVFIPTAFLCLRRKNRRNSISF